jgi:uncharacterized protein YkwD
MRWGFVTLLAPVLLTLQVGPVSAAGAGDQSGYIDRVLELTNVERQKAGLAPLALNPQLNDAAQRYSQVLAVGSCFEHTCGAVPNFVDRVGQAGYTGYKALGENIAAGFPTPEAVVAGWMSSSGHRANILSPRFREIGIGLVNGEGKYGAYWTQEFGARPEATMSFAQLPVVEPEAAPTDDSAGASD